MKANGGHQYNPEVTAGRLREAAAVARRIPEVMRRRGLPPAFSEWVVTTEHDMVWLFGILDTRRVKKLEHYTNANLLHHLATDIGGRPVYLSNSDGLRYAILLSGYPELSSRLDFTDALATNFDHKHNGRHLVALGQQLTGVPLTVPWKNLGHLLVAGMTGSGKSNFLRLMAYQGLRSGHCLLLADVDNRTFPMLAEHPALLAPIATTPDAMRDLVERALGECDHRSKVYNQVPNFPDTLEEFNKLAVREGVDPLPRVLVILDEYNAAVTALGGHTGPLASATAELGWRGRKFGVNLIFAAQDFVKSVVGRVRDQINAVVCFRVRSRQVANAVGVPEAMNIPKGRPGRAYTDIWGPIQTYYLEKERLIALGQRHTGPSFSEEEQALIERAMRDADGRMSIPLLQEWGLSTWSARQLLKEWELRGWVAKNPQQQNARYITSKLEGLFTQT
jgi:hypothetical protein